MTPHHPPPSGSINHITQVVWRRGEVDVRANERFASLFISAAEGERALRRGRTRPEYLWGRSVRPSVRR